MTKLTKILAILFVLFFVVSKAQYDDGGQPPAGDDDGQGQYTSDQQETVIQRNKLIACIILSRHKFNDINDELGVVLRQSSASQSLYKKNAGRFYVTLFFHD